jgi:WhiB family redox-sensing transcriptional regulator
MTAPVFIGDLLATAASGLSWQDYAACRGTDRDAFYPPRGSTSGDAAKRVCAICLVRTECLEDALERNDKHGIWGGLSEKERRALQAQRREEALRSFAETLDQEDA